VKTANIGAPLRVAIARAMALPVLCQAESEPIRHECDGEEEEDSAPMAYAAQRADDVPEVEHHDEPRVASVEIPASRLTIGNSLSATGEA